MSDGGLGSHLVGGRVQVRQRILTITKLLGEGGFSYVYQVKEVTEQGKGDDASGQSPFLALKVTSIHSRSQRDIAEKEAKLLSRLSHPSIIKMFDTCYRNHTNPVSTSKRTERPQHLILMEYCEGGHALGVCTNLKKSGKRFDLSTLIIAFGQICNAVSYLHAQRPPIIHRDLKPVNFLVKNGAYKLADFGSAIFGHVDLRTPKARADAEEVVKKTTTQMFRAPEMVDLYSAKKLTQATDVWALGCCLYSLAFLKNCFEEGSNLAILSRKYTIPEDNPYGEGLVELLDRMLTVDSKARADMTEVILCLSAVYSGRPLPPRKKRSKGKKSDKRDERKENKKKNENNGPRVGSYRIDGQGRQEAIYDPTKATEGKKLASNSVAARRAAAKAKPSRSASPVPAKTADPPAMTSDPFDFSSMHADGKIYAGNSFGELKAFETQAGDSGGSSFFNFFGSKSEESGTSSNNAFDATFDTQPWGDTAQQEFADPAAPLEEFEVVLQEEKIRSGRRTGRSPRSSSRSRATTLESSVKGLVISGGGETQKRHRSRSTRRRVEI